MNLIKRAWKGETKLWVVFWVYGLLIAFLFKPLSYVLLVAMPMLWPAVVVLSLVYCVWWLVSLWRCAYNTKWKFFGHAARAYVVLVPLLVLLSFVFNDRLMKKEIDEPTPTPAVTHE